MAKTMQTGHPGRTEAPSAASDDTKKQRKKQAKREAKMMLKVEQARKDVQKAEQKVAKAQTDLESTKTHLSKLEAQVQELSAPATSSATATAPKKRNQQNPGSNRQAPRPIPATMRNRQPVQHTRQQRLPRLARNAKQLPLRPLPLHLLTMKPLFLPPKAAWTLIRHRHRNQGGAICLYVCEWK